MPTKPSVTPEIFAADLNYSSLTGGAALQNGTPTKVDGGASFRGEGGLIGKPALAQWYNYDFNVWSQYVKWTAEGTNAADEDAHIVETEADGRLRAAFGQFTDGGAAHPVVQIDVTGANNGLLLTGGALSTAAYGVDIDMSSVTSNGTGIRVKGAPAKPALDISAQGAVPAMLVSSDGVTVPPSQPDTGVSATSTTGTGYLGTCFGAGNAAYFANTSTGSALKIESTGGGGGTVGVVEIESDRTVPAINMTQSGDGEALMLSCTHSGGSPGIDLSYQGAGFALQVVHSGAAGRAIYALGSLSSTDPVAYFTAQNASSSALATFTSTTAITSSYAVRATGQGDGGGVTAASVGAGTAANIAAIGTGTAARISRGSQVVEINPASGTSHFTLTQFSADPSVSGSVTQVWSRDFAGLNKIAATYKSGTGRVLINASKYGHVYAITDELAGSFSETTAPSTYSVPGGTCSWEDDAFPISVAGDVYWRITGRIRRSTIGTMPEVFNIGVMPYDVTAAANMYGTLTGVPVDFINTAGGEHWVHFCATGTYTLPAIGSRQFQVRFEQQGGGGTTNGVCSYSNVVMEVWQPQHNA